MGLLASAMIAALAPYNDLLMGNSFLIGGTMPIGLLIFFLFLVVLINAPLRRWMPKQALSGGELAIALGIGLVGCAVPAVGFHNYVMGSLVGLWTQAEQDVSAARLLNALNLPAWLFPVSQTTDAARAAMEPAVSQFIGRVPQGEAVPWSAWCAPAAAWGAWFICFVGAVLCLALIVRRQWVENERLTFPVARVYTALLEEPEPGHAINSTLRSWMFWFPFAAVFLLRAVNCLSVYLPLYVPSLPLGFDLRPITTEPPLSHAHVFFKAQNIYFAVIGITFLLQTRIAFSLWFMYLMFQLVVMITTAGGGEFSAPMQQDQTAGALLVSVAIVLWIGRAHWAMVGRHILGRRRPEDPDDPYIPYRVAGWGMVLCSAGMIVFLVLARSSVPGAVLSVLLLLLIGLMIARIAAETGLYYIQINVPLNQSWNYLQASVGARTTTGSFFWTSFLGGAFTHDTRESLSVYSTHALRVSDELAAPNHRRQGAGFVMAMMASLLVAFAVGGVSMLRMDYAHATTLTTNAAGPVNQYGVEYVPRELVLRPTLAYQQGGDSDRHSRFTHVSIGAGLTALLGVLRFRYANWPLHPLGFLLAFTFPVARMWFSIFLGWLAKATVVHYGGGAMLGRLRAAALGLIVGEAAAVAFWLLVAVACAAGGLEYHVIFLTP